ncbi:Adhesion G-protein coupled receptor G2 [Amphibalanus amphitrite]|uniref:Adhesion G-protein coupled receptor G2 n=1 Tax=Amphibalanus amphitrite TaxID=1232801 RepID=A0A6A4W9U0_AMPAM|nr:Adhesion G-protein coupled receptor G2 [Amphibalanus amphitrite]
MNASHFYSWTVEETSLEDNSTWPLDIFDNETADANATAAAGNGGSSSSSAASSTTTTTTTTITTRPTTSTPSTTTELDESYQASADYHWGSLNGNAEVYPARSRFRLGGGPFGFKTSVKLPGGMCLLHNDFAFEDDSCVQNPQNCSEGLSFSLWHKASYDETLMYSERYIPRQALISTGGDLQGTPGLLVYLQNHVLGVVVSTGSLYWRASVSGLLVNHAWNSIGVRWQAPGSADEQTVRGLQLFINQQRVAAMVNGLPASPRPPVEPVQLMVGCHRTSTRSIYSEFCADCELDEVAIWRRALPDHQLSLFNGGHKEARALSAHEFSSIVGQVNLRDLEQQQQAVQVLIGVLSKTDKESEAGGGSEDETDMEELSDIMETMTDLKTLKRSQTADELDKLAVRPMNAAGVVRGLEDWVMASVSRVPLRSDNDTVLVNKKTDNIQMTMKKMKLGHFKEAELASFPEGDEDKDGSVELPTTVFNKEGCDDTPINIVFGKYDTLGDVAPRRVAESDEMTSREAELVNIDSAVLSLRVSVGDSEGRQERDDDTETDVSSCLPTSEQLRAAPVKTQLTHKTQTPALRKTLFHTEPKSDILRRLCVWWNPELSDGAGGWDPTGCEATDQSTELVTICACENFGQYAVMTEKVEPKRIPEEAEAARFIKYFLYAISGILLLLFILVVTCRPRVGDMFHRMRQHTALALVALALCTCLSDLEAVRRDRHSCAAIGVCTQFFHLVTAVMLACEGYANFRAVIEGTVGGKLGTYICLAWGLPSMVVGYTLVSSMDQLGDDPRCVLGWSASLKARALLGPLVLADAAALLAAAVAACNSGHARVRVDLRAEVRSLSRGHVVFTVLQTVGHTLALVCYVVLAGDDSEGAAVAYSLFQTYAALQGVFFFFIMGYMSMRFKRALPCSGRREQLKDEEQ